MNGLFTVVALELFLGGGGRLTELGPVTVRMILFALCLCCAVFVAVYRPRRNDGVALALALVATYLMVHLPAVIIGVVSGALPGDIATEMQQSLYWLAAPFFAAALASQHMVARAAVLIRLSGVLMAGAYLLTLAGLVLGLVDFVWLYATLNATGEFFFRGESFFFYKGFLYLGIAMVFLLALKSPLSSVMLLVVALALVLTLTRGFVLSASFAIILMLAALKRWRAVSLAVIAIAVAALLVLVYLPSVDDSYLDQRDLSNATRRDDFAFILDNLKASTLLFGSGFGSLINGRVAIENTFLWALWRLGIAGLAFWLLPLALSLHYFIKVPARNQQHRLACAFFFGTVLVYVQTLTNPYLNNPIGLSFVLIALFSLRTISRVSAPSKSYPQRVTSEVRGGALEGTQ